VRVERVGAAVEGRRLEDGVEVGQGRPALAHDQVGHRAVGQERGRPVQLDQERHRLGGRPLEQGSRPVQLALGHRLGRHQGQVGLDPLGRRVAQRPPPRLHVDRQRLGQPRDHA
jgi:hypothetical protein